MLRLQWSRGQGLSVCDGDRCLGGVVTNYRPKPSYCWFTGYGEMGCLSVPVADAKEGWSLR